jgi:hypothetical protein
MGLILVGAIAVSFVANFCCEPLFTEWRYLWTGLYKNRYTHGV